MPRWILPKKLQFHDRTKRQPSTNETYISGKMIAIGSFVIGLMTAVATVWIAFGTPTSYRYAETRNQKTILTLENGKLKDENKALQREIDNNKTDIETQKSIVKNLQLDKQKVEEEVSNLIEKRRSLEEKNNSLLEKNNELESRSKGMIFQSFLGEINNRLKPIRLFPLIRVLVKGYGDKELYSSVPISCDFHSKITDVCWRSTIFTLVLILKDGIREKKVVVNYVRPITLKDLVESAFEEIGKSDPAGIDFVKNNHKKLHYYIISNRKFFETPLNFRFTDLDMKTEDADTERERLFSILHKETYVGKHKFDSKIHAEIFKLFQYLGFNQ